MSSVEIPLVNSDEVIIVDSDIASYINLWRWHLLDDKDGKRYAIRTAYAYKIASRKHHTFKVYMHRVIAKAFTETRIDHKNGNTFDNRTQNLRPCTHKENMRNRRANTGSLYKGVRERCGKFVASINPNGTQIHLGTFDTLEKAIAARVKAERLAYGEFAREDDSP